MRMLPWLATRPAPLPDSVSRALAIFVAGGMVMSQACAVSPASGGSVDKPRISVAAYRDKVYASWLGQIAGNIYGLSYEFKYIAEPGPDAFPYGFGPTLERVRNVDGAFSDDDTDIEYMYLLQMERHGIEPTYEQLADAWTYHVRDKIWVANRAALTLMRAGYGPPVTGSKHYNPQWFQIDPQLVNEIWAVTAPGMVSYAAEKSAWAARITSDDFGLEPTIHYAAMYSAAFFETDIHRLIDIGSAALPEDSRFRRTVEHMKVLYRQYPDDWQAARREMADRYFAASEENGFAGAFDYNRHAWAPVDANLNGACAILALLYGGGDFQRTLDVASGLGFDADNQAATMGGLLGIIHGLDGLPEDLLFPLGAERWDHPFNDHYKNVSRHDLPDASLRDMAARIAAQGEQVILAHGGSKVSVEGVQYYEIDPSARFEKPFELIRAPLLVAETGGQFTFPVYSRGPQDLTRFENPRGALPPGLALREGLIVGTPDTPGLFEFVVQARRGDEVRTRTYIIEVHGENLARRATRILHNDPDWSGALEVIRDGQRRGRTFYSEGGDKPSQTDHYGYEWQTPQRISTLILNAGLPHEFGGWFTSLQVQYRSESGEWLSVDRLSIEPGMDFDNSQWLKGSYIDHTLRFAPITTRAVRVIGTAGGIVPDAHTGESRRYYTAISELAVYAD